MSSTIENKLISELIDNKKISLIHIFGSDLFKSYHDKLNILLKNFLENEILQNDDLKSLSKYISEIYPMEYVGELKNGNPNGKGKLILNSKIIYEGEFENSSKHGNGTYYDKNNVKYELLWKNNSPISGKIYYENGVYDGQVNKDINPHGKGKLYKNNKLIFEGQFDNGIKTFGIMFENSSEDECYQGIIKNEKINGFGRIIYPKENRSIIANWVDGRIYGSATMNIQGVYMAKLKYTKGSPEWIDIKYLSTHHPVYSYFGTIDEDFNPMKINGHGIIIYKDRSVYNGDVRDLKRNGVGILEKDGVIYECNWKNDMKDGNGYIINMDNNFKENKIWIDDNEIVVNLSN